MQAYHPQQFDVLLHTAADRFAAQLTRSCSGPGPALEQLRGDASGAGVRLHAYVETVFAQACLDDVAGAAFVLQALHRRLVNTEETVADVLCRLAKGVFAELLAAKVVEVLARAESQR